MSSEKTAEWFSRMKESYGNDGIGGEMMDGIERAVSDLDPYDEEAVFEAFGRCVEELVVFAARRDLASTEGDESKVEAVVDHLREVFAGSLRDPDPRVQETFRNIFDQYPYDETIVYREFARWCDPLLARLRKREAGKRSVV